MPEQEAPPSPGFEVDMPAEDTQAPPSELGITEERLAEITDSAVKQIENFRIQMGLSSFPSGGTNFPILSPVGTVGTWTWRRQCARMSYRGDYVYRRALGGIWLENGPTGGWSLNVTKRFVDSLATKAEDDILGSDVFFSAMPDNIQDPQQVKLSKQVETKIQQAVQESNLRQTLAESIRIALTEGERCVKLVYRVDQTQYIGDAEVMIDPATNEPFRTPKGDYVFRKDNVLLIVIDMDGKFVRIATPVQPFATDENGQPTEFLQRRLEKEPQVIMPDEPLWELRNGLVLTITHKDGIESDGLFAEDFIYDIYSPRLKECKLMSHVYDLRKEEIMANYPDSGYADRLARLTPTGPLSQASQPITDAGEQWRVAYDRDMINIHETYYRLKVNPQDEHESWLFLVIDMTNRLPVYSEYLGNMKMKRPPFGLIRGLRAEAGRAYGVGIYADFYDQNLAIDLTFNRLCLKDSKEGSVTFVNKAMIQECQDGHKLVIGGKEYYTINSTWTEEVGPKNPPVFRINLNEMTGDAWEIIDKLVSAGQLAYGVVSIGELEASDSGIAQGGTATATRNIERTGNVMQKSMQRMQADDILGILDLAVDLILENADPMDLAWVPGENELAELNREEIRNLPRDIRLNLTRSKGTEVLETNTQATQLVQTYYSYPLSLRVKVRQFFINQLRALEIADADELLDEPTPEEIQAEAAQQQKEPPKESVSIALKDLKPLTPQERAQALSQLNIQASPPEEVMAMEQQEDAKEAAAREHEASLKPQPQPEAEHAGA